MNKMAEYNLQQSHDYAKYRKRVQYKNWNVLKYS